MQETKVMYNKILFLNPQDHQQGLWDWELVKPRRQHRWSVTLDLRAQNMQKTKTKTKHTQSLEDE